MTLDLFSVDKIEFEINEFKQYERVKKKMIEQFHEEEEKYYVIVDFIINNIQYDLIIIKPNGIFVVELKGYLGEVMGSETGPWEVKRQGTAQKIKQRKNPFEQAVDQRYALIRYLNPMLKKISDRFKEEDITHVNSIICFERRSTYDYNQIDHKKHMWLQVIDEDHLVEAIERTSTKQFLLKNVEINAMIEKMHLQKMDVEMPKDMLVISAKSVLSNEDIIRITERMVEEYGSDGFVLEDLQDTVGPEVAARYMHAAQSQEIIKKGEGSKHFFFIEGWSDKLPEVIEDEDVCSADDISRYSQDDFSLKPAKPKEGVKYDGVYRGTNYHINFKKEVWWRPGNYAPKIKASFSDEEILEKILELKPVGGSFRITESKEVLTKVFLESQGYVSVYVGKLMGEIELEDYLWKPDKLKDGNLWPSLYDGTTFSVNSNGDLKIHIGEMRAFAKEGHEDLVSKVLTHKREGGRFKINENGYILTLMYKLPYPDEIRKQMESLTDKEKTLIDIRSRTDRDGMVPTYLGKFKGNITFKKLFDLDAEWSEKDIDSFVNRITG